MSSIRMAKRWEIADSAATPEAVYLGRRRFLARLGLGGAALGAGAGLLGCIQDNTTALADGGGVPAGDLGGARADGAGWAAAHADLYPAAPNDAYKVQERGISPEDKATRYNNFYEFTTSKSGVWKLVDNFVVYPWTVEVGGLVPKPKTYDLDDLVRQLSLEERVYRFRCVEAWSMTVPWTGFPLSKLIKLVQPSSSAKYIRFVSKVDRWQMPGLDEWYPWPYHEALRMDEAMNDLAFVVTGLYGKPLPRQNGAPVRMALPWKYGYKGAKSIVKIEFVAEQPDTFWNTLVPAEYGFLSNVDPAVPHPRWSQATEQLIDTGERIPTLPYNGYAEQVADLYT